MRHPSMRVDQAVDGSTGTVTVRVVELVGARTECRNSTAAFRAFRQLGAEVVDRAAQTLVERNGGRPPGVPSAPVRCPGAFTGSSPAAARAHRRRRAGQRDHLAREVEDRPGLPRLTGPVTSSGSPSAAQAVDQVVDVAERARLAAVAVDGDRLAPQRLHDEVRHHAAVVRRCMRGP